MTNFEIFQFQALKLHHKNIVTMLQTLPATVVLFLANLFLAGCCRVMFVHCLLINRDNDGDDNPIWEKSYDLSSPSSHPDDGSYDCCSRYFSIGVCITNSTPESHTTSCLPTSLLLEQQPSNWACLRLIVSQIFGVSVYNSLNLLCFATRRY